MHGKPRMDLGQLTDDALTGGFRLWQRRRGHRYSLDDVLTAYVALQALPAPLRCLDLGCGIGSVLLMLAYKLPHATLCGIEAQAQSKLLASRNVDRNGVGQRVSLIEGDFRQPQVRAEGLYDLVTGTPPYQPLGAGTLSPDSQRAHARVELRGGVEDYLAVAARYLVPAGRFVVCADARTPQRVERGAKVAGLHVHAVCHAQPAEHKAALFSVWTLGCAPVTNVEESLFVARTAQGQRTAHYQAVRQFFDLSKTQDESASPPVRLRTASSVKVVR